MKKRLVNLIAAIVMIFCGLFALSSCDNKTETGGGNEEVRQGLEYKTLNVDGTNVYGKVSNATETFSFLEEITANGASKFIVALDIYGAKQVATKTIPLSVGDNTAYIMETIDGETVKMYTVTVRRRPIYTVSFNSAGGTEVQPQRVEEDSFAAEPAAQSKAGYTFEKWNYDFSKPITQNTSVGAVWKAHTDTPYKVQYYWENANDNGYTLHETVDLQGETDTTATAQIKSYEHFSHKSTATDGGNINGNGSLVLKVYYTRDSYTVTFDGNGGTDSYYNETQKTYTVKYGGKVTAPEFTRTGYTQNGWDQPIPETISGNTTFTAEWQVNQYTLTLVFGGVLENKTITQDYNTKIEHVYAPDREGYVFSGWDKIIPETMPAENFTVCATWTAIFRLYDGGYSIAGLTEYGARCENIVIPSEIDGVKITSIAWWAFQGKTNLISIIISEGVTSIEECAFVNCEQLTDIILPDSLAFIGNRAFEGCDKLTFNIKGNLKYLGNSERPYLYLADVVSDDITEAKIDETCKIIGYSALDYCRELKKLLLPDSIITICDFAFEFCSGLTSVILGNNVLTIGDSAFFGCDGLTNITLPNSVITIGDRAFLWCEELTNVSIGNGVKTIGYSAFDGCSGLTSITIPDSVTSIGESAFSGCTGLISVIIPDGVTDINSRTFSGCSGLTAITVGKGVTFIEASAFNGCSGLTNITLSDKVTYIGDAAFSDCSSLTSITIGNGLAYIGYGVFNGCTELEKVYYKGTAEEWKKISVGGENRNLTGATRYYYSEAKPTASGNYWHYKENGEIEEW